MARMGHTVRISVYQVPELIFKLRQEMADFLRVEAGQSSNPDVAKRLRELAATFDVGATKKTNG